MEINSNFKIKKEKNKIYLLDSNYLGDILYEFEDTGFYIINFINNNYNCKIDDIANYLKNLYTNVDYKVICEDINSFLNELFIEGILIGQK